MIKHQTYETKLFWIKLAMVLPVQNDFMYGVKDERLTFLGFHRFEDLSIKLGMHENSKFGRLLWRVILKFPIFAKYSKRP